jgi:hypothetical protein
MGLQAPTIFLLSLFPFAFAALGGGGKGKKGIVGMALDLPWH